MFVAGLVAVASILSLVPSAHATSASDARKSLVNLAETGATASVDQVRSLVEAYRIDSSQAFMPLATAPYPRFLLNSQLKDVYPALYSVALKDLLGPAANGVKDISTLSLETLYDVLLGMVANDKVPDSLKDDLSKISVSMAKRAIEGKSADCKLDPSEKINKPGILALLSTKFFPTWSSPCTVRQRIYNEAKEDLIKAKKGFPDEYRKGFLAKVDSTIADFPQLINQKFGVKKNGDKVAMHAIWGPNGAIVEASDESRVSGGRRPLSMKFFAEGLLADLYAARVLSASSNPMDQSLAAGLFYAVVNRWLLIVGGTTADWDAGKKEIPVAQTGTGLQPPKFREIEFGGYGIEASGMGYEASSWDLENYDPSREKKPSRVRIFPTRFEVNPDGVAFVTDPADAFQTNEDLGLLLLCVADFLKATQPGSPFAKYFGNADQAGDLLDTTKPMLFPSDGRLIAVGLLSMVAKNLLNPTIGHVGQSQTGLRIFFRDHARLSGTIDTTDLDAVAVSRMLVSGAKLMRVLSVDPVLKLKPELKAILPDVKNLVMLGGLVVAKSSEAGFQGAFHAKLNSSDASTSVDAQIATLQILFAGYNESNPRSAFHAAWIAPGLKYLFETDLAKDAAPLTQDERLRVQMIWNDSQAALRAAQPDLPWAQWEARVRALR